MADRQLSKELKQYLALHVTNVKMSDPDNHI
jgi:hypothetical protein